MSVELALVLAALAVAAAAGPLLAVAWARRRLLRAGSAAESAAAEHLRTVVRAAPLGLAVAEGTEILWTNPAAGALLASPSAEPPLREALEAVARTGEAVSAELGAGGERVRLQCLPLPARPGEPRLTLVAVSAERAPATGTVAPPDVHRELAHELRTPLTAIIGHVSLLEDPQSSAEVRARSHAAIRSEAVRMSRLVEDLLELSRLEAPDAALYKKPTHVAVEIEEAAAAFVPRAEARNVELSLLVSSALPRVALDRDRFRQVVSNLVDNAVKFSRPGDRVTVSCQPDGDAVVLEVADTGPGVAAEDLPHLTTRLYRAGTNASGAEGAGLGLAVVDRIVRLHDGSLELESAAGGGFVARVRLPAGAPP